MSAQPKPEFPWQLVPMQRSHLSEIMAIERRAYDFPWNEGVFRDCLRAGYSAWVALDVEAAVRGYAVMSMGAGEAHVLNLCVDPDWQRQGLGYRFMQHLLRLARAGRIERMLLEVRRSNRAAQGLYEGLGFVRVGLRRGYYPAHGAREDAWVLAYELDRDRGLP